MAKKNNMPAEVVEETVSGTTSAVEVSDSHSESQEESAATQQRIGPLYKVTWPQGLNLRKDPGLEHPVLKVLSFGSVVEARGEAVTVNDSNWLPVQDGWCDAQFLEQIDNKE